MINLLFLIAFCTALSVITIRIAIRLASYYSIADHPGEHKQHNESTPFVGGSGLYAVLCIALVMLFINYPEHTQKWLALGICSTIIFITGFVDDVFRLNYKSRLFIQAFVALIMVLVGGIVLYDLGGLLFGLPLQLGLFAVPFTVFAIIGGINIINMIDGIDGLSGSLSLVSLLLLAIVASIAGDMSNLMLIIALLGGMIGFLLFNFPFRPKHNARVFLGDNGSMLTGLLFAWLLVDLAQGPDSAMTSVTAIWLLSIPLMDAISVMHRRLRVGSSPFKPDRNHLHHILLKAGYSVEEVVFVIVTLHFLMGVVGLTGLYLGVPDYVMFLGFILAYFGYFYLTLRSWYYIPVLCYLHTRLRLTPKASNETFVGDYSVIDAENVALRISKEIRSKIDYWIQIFKKQELENNSKQQYVLALNVRLPKGQRDSYGRIKKFISLLQQRLRKKHNIQLRHLAARAEDRDWRMSSNDGADNLDTSCVVDRRSNVASYGTSRDVDRRNGPRRRASRRSHGSHVVVFEIII